MVVDLKALGAYMCYECIPDQNISDHTKLWLIKCEENILWKVQLVVQCGGLLYTQVITCREYSMYVGNNYYISYNLLHKISLKEASS